MVKKTKALKSVAKDAGVKDAKTEAHKSTKVDTVELVEEETKKLLNLIKVEAELVAKEDQENEAIAVQLTTEEPGIMIGFHGETLAAFQLILSLVVNKKLETWTRILVNVNDYRQKREESLRMVALNAAQKVKFSNESVVLTNLSPSERRIIHLTLADHPDVESLSEGQGQERRLVIKPRLTR
jgi:spoIIIJ-associated protein